MGSSLLNSNRIRSVRALQLQSSTKCIMKDYFLIFFVVFLACSNAEYSYPTPAVPFPTPSDEYLPPPTTTTEKVYEPDSNIFVPEILIPRTSTTPNPTTTPKPTTTTEHEHHHHDVPFWTSVNPSPVNPNKITQFLIKFPQLSLLAMIDLMATMLIWKLVAKYSMSAQDYLMVSTFRALSCAPTELFSNRKPSLANGGLMLNVLQAPTFTN